MLVSYLVSAERTLLVLELRRAPRACRALLGTERFEVGEDLTKVVHDDVLVVYIFFYSLFLFFHVNTVFRHALYIYTCMHISNFKYYILKLSKKILLLVTNG
jgi:hypothetical protein